MKKWLNFIAKNNLVALVLGLVLIQGGKAPQEAHQIGQAAEAVTDAAAQVVCENGGCDD